MLKVITIPAVDVKQAAPEVQKVIIPTLETSTLEGMVESFVSMHDFCVKHDVKKVQKEMEDIRKKLVDIANENGEPNVPFHFTAGDATIVFSERAEQTKITDVNGLLTFITEKLGEEAAQSVIQIALTPLRKLLTDVELAKFSEKVPGSRTLKSVTHANSEEEEL